ncbi:MAG: helix-turn-helix domain-containing protein [Myxococcales bacterium]|nr:helix-turn-helix domain-containing protein [Myxococcales bacterium]
MQSPLIRRLEQTDHAMGEREVAEVLGVAVATLRRWRWAGTPNLPFRKIGRAVKYDPADVLAFLEQGRRASTSDLGPEA